MKLLTLVLGTIMLFSYSCTNYGLYGDYNYDIVEEPNMPNTYDGRVIDDYGTIYVTSKYVTLYVWDSDQIDGDIVSVIVNDDPVLSNYTLTGTRKSISLTLDNNGYNYILVYAHNEGSITPNTCTLAIDDGNGEQTLILSSDLSTNSGFHVYVEP